MKDLLNLGQMLSVHARLSPGRMGASDLRSMSLATSNECACRLTNTLFGRSRKKFDPDHCVSTLAESHPSFTSLVPTHHIMMPGLPAAARARHRLDRATKRYRRMQRRVQPRVFDLQSLAAWDDAEREWRGSALSFPKRQRRCSADSGLKWKRTNTEQANACLHATVCRTRSREVKRSRLETAMAHTIATISVAIELCSEKLSDN